MPVLVAIRSNGSIKSFAQRLAENGKTKMVIIGAVMKKLVHLMYEVLKTKLAFNPAYVITLKSRIEEVAA